MTLLKDAKPYPVRFETDTTALLLIDMQRDFLAPGGFGEMLGNDVSLLRGTVEPCRALLQAARATNMSVLHTREGHRPDLSGDAPPSKIGRGNPPKRIGELGPGEAPVFHPVRAPTAGELQTLLNQIIWRLMRLLTRQGYLIEEQGMTYLADPDPDNALAPLQAAACTYRIAFGPRAGQKVLSLHTVPTQAPPPATKRCVSDQGFSLHAEVCCAAHQRHKLEHLCRYITRPAITNERLKRNRAGDVVLQLKTAYQDGTTHIVMSPLEFMQRLAVLVPRPRLPLLYGRLPDGKVELRVLEQIDCSSISGLLCRRMPAGPGWNSLTHASFHGRTRSPEADTGLMGRGLTCLPSHVILPCATVTVCHSFR